MPFTPKRWGNPISDSGALEADELTDMEVRLAAYADSVSGGGVAKNISVLDYGAVADGSTDSSVGIQAAIDASALGDTIWFPGKFRAKDISIKPYRTYAGVHAAMGGDGSTIELPDGATSASYIFASESYVTNAVTPDASIVIRDLGFYGNSANIASGTQHLVILRCWRPVIQRVTFADARGQGLRFTPYSADATAATGQVSEGRVHDCIFSNNVGSCLYAVRNASGNTTVDFEIHNCNFSGIVSNTENQLTAEGAGGWKVSGCHFWKSGGWHMSLENPYGTWVDSCTFETVAEAKTSSSYYCINIGTALDHPVVVSNCVAYQDFVTAAVRGFVYVGNSGALSPNVVIANNNYFSVTATDIFCHLQGDNGGTAKATITGNMVTGALKYIDLGGTTEVNQSGNSWNWITGASPPAAGSFIQGTQVWRRDAALSAAPGWVCTTGGTPGTWKAMASLAA
jgi:hypothetical protein